MQFNPASWVVLFPFFFIVFAVAVRALQSTRQVVGIIQLLTVMLLTVGLSFLGYIFLVENVQETPGLFAANSVNVIVLNLILFMALVLIGFSRNYMQGEACYRRFFVWMLLTLAAVAFTVVSNHLALLWLGWVAISLCLHNLLTLYPERPRAVLAAHKKFILARTAEAFLLLAFVLLYLSHGTPYISIISDELLSLQLSAQFSQSTQLGWEQQLAAVFIAIAAMIKCAQLPVHGWLIKVVEAPTPVSALLHAGVINMGGFMLILFAPLISLAVFAQWLLLIVAGVSTLLAALIMTTRISVKVRLAWSTSAQMGLMLLQCALGLYELALLHLILHSAYKAHAFLSSGNAVIEHGKAQLTEQTGSRSVAVMLSGVWVFASIAAILTASAYQGPLGIWLLLGFALTALLAAEASDARNHAYKAKRVVRAAVMVSSLAMVYASLKAVFGSALGLPENLSVEAFSAADIWFSALVVTAFAVHAMLVRHSDKPIVQKLSSQLFAGLYLDEWFTRTTLKLWSAKLPRVNDVAEVSYSSIDQPRA